MPKQQLAPKPSAKVNKKNYTDLTDFRRDLVLPSALSGGPRSAGLSGLNL